MRFGQDVVPGQRRRGRADDVGHGTATRFALEQNRLVAFANAQGRMLVVVSGAAGAIFLAAFRDAVEPLEDVVNRQHAYASRKPGHTRWSHRSSGTLREYGKRRRIVTRRDFRTD